MRISIIAAAAAAIFFGGTAAGTSPAVAATLLSPNPLVHENVTTTNPIVEEVQYRRRGYHRYPRFGSRRIHRPRRHFGRYHYPRHYGFRRRDRGSAVAAGIFGLALGAIAGQALAPRTHYYGGYPYGGYRYYGGSPGSGHVDWCLRNYRSYDIGSDTFLGYDGYRHRCNSPYAAW